MKIIISKHFILDELISKLIKGSRFSTYSLNIKNLHFHSNILDYHFNRSTNDKKIHIEVNIFLLTYYLEIIIYIYLLIITFINSPI